MVGPNGSGKSNVADSLRWVFGEQSMKLLRGKKSEDVIFAGSDQKARLGGAEVLIYFDNADRKMAIDYSEVVIGRRLYRDGTSQYLLNGSEVRMLDIQELLAKSGFGNTSYYVIGQGMIDQLILRGPSGVKELIEEASGIKPYYLKRERTMRRLEQTEGNLEKARALLAEIEPRLRSLRRQTKRLERRAEIEKELRDTQILYFGHMLHGIDSQLAETTVKAKTFDRELAELNRQIAELSKGAEAQEQENKESVGLYRKLQTDLESLQKSKFALQEELAVVRGNLKVQQAQSAKTKAIDLRALEQKFETAYNRLEKLVENFTPGEAQEVKQLFAEIARMLKPQEKAAPGLEFSELVTQEKKLGTDLEALFTKIEKVQKDLASFTEREQELKQQIFVKERLLRSKQDQLIKTSDAKNQLAVEEARIATRRETLEQDAVQALGSEFRKLTEHIKTPHVPAGSMDKIMQLKKQLEMIGGVDELLVAEYRETEDRYQHLTTQSEDLKKGVTDLRTVIAELDDVIKEEFHSAFTNISEKFGEYFKTLFGGGKAVMTLVRERPMPAASTETEEDSEEEAEETKESKVEPETGKLEITGIDIKATPPGKKLAAISALSGGERALTSIALLSAILATFPSPFVVLDEVDAALDEANSIRFGKILGTLAHKTQFITITHNRETMRQSHTLYGITMGEDGVSRVLSLKLEQAAVYSTKN